MISTERAISMTNHPRRILKPGASRKRKERDDPDTLKPSTTTSIPTKSDPPQDPDLVPKSSNRLLAGYLAHEFLTQGTLFGQKWDPAAAVTVKKVARGAESAAAHQTYAAVANLMKTDGTHIPGIVNPTQLAQWIQM